MEATADLQNLEYLSLVSKITIELSNYLGITDKTLAEFIINLHLQTKTPAEFRSKIASHGVDFPDSLITSIDRLVLTMHPEHTKAQLKKPEENGGAARKVMDLDTKARVFKALALPDKEVPAAWDEEKPPGDSGAGPESGNPSAISDVMAMLEDLEEKSKAGGKKGSTNTGGDALAFLESMDPGRARGDSGKSKKRSRSPSPEAKSRRYRSRSRSRDRGREKERERRVGIERDEYGRDRKRDKRKYRYEDSDDDFGRPPATEVDERPVLFKVYDGKVTGIKDFGVFVNLLGVKGKVDGLVHVSAIKEERVNHPSDLLAKGQSVKVKVINIQGTRIGLSMQDVDQKTGRDLDSTKRIASGANMERLDGTGASSRYGTLDPHSIPVPEAIGDQQSVRSKKRMTSPERWEIKQLIASGAVPASDYPDIDEEYHATLTGEGVFEEEEDVDIEVRGEEPPFLAGQTRQSLELSPIRVVKAPDGSLNRAAMGGTALAKERRELRQQQAADSAAVEAQKVDLNAQWQDPMVAPNDRKFALDLKNSRLHPGGDMPEWKRATMGKSVSYGRITNKSIKEQRESLPVFKLRSSLIKAVEENQLLIVVGDTGSGKTTQMTQYLAEAGSANQGIIGCTQPRRVAAMSVAKRVAEEVGCRVGQEVGYTIRFEDCTSPETKIKYMTDGMLQREVLLDPDLRRYSVIMLDEAHERTIATDVLFGLLKKTLKRRPDLKLIVTSATLDAEKFSNYFNQCPIFTIPGRTYPVEILYTKEPESDYLDAALITVMQIHLSEPPGDILLFLTGQEEIDTSCEILYERMKALGSSVPELIILPVYSALPSEMQSKIFEPAPPGSRKVVIATNIAETSITIDQIYYVIDPGFVKQNAFDPKLGMDSLVVTPISQAQAKQRAGRAGRTGPGKCYRLYTETAFQSEMLPTSVPEIQRQNLSHTILMLKAMGINDLLHFDFMDPPPTNTMLTALEELYALSALDDEGLLTRLGRKMADFPMEPALAKVLIASVNMGCSDEMLSIVAMLSVQTVFYRPKEKQTQADQKKSKFHDPHGDHLTLLNVYNGWKKSGYTNPWCYDNFIQARSMKRAKDVRAQLEMIMKRYNHKVESCGRDTTKVRQALCSGFFRNSARKDPHEGYKTLIEGTPVYMHPSSALFGKSAEHVIFHTLVMTTKEYMHCTTSIEPKWLGKLPILFLFQTEPEANVSLVECAPSFFKVGGGKGELSKRRKNERIQPLFNRFGDGDDSWRLSSQKRQGRGGGGGTWG